MNITLRPIDDSNREAVLALTVREDQPFVATNDYSLKEAAEEGYDLYIDLHRDSYSSGNGQNTVPVDGTDTARILILIGQGTGSSLEEKPDWQQNQRAAQRIANALNERVEGLCRGVSLKSGRYNQQAASPSMLIEVGNNKNILPEAIAAAEPLARAICRYLDTMEQRP